MAVKGDQDLPAKKGRRVAQSWTTSPRRGKRALIRVFYENEDVVIDYDGEDRPVGIEIMNASDVLGGPPASVEVALPSPSPGR